MKDIHKFAYDMELKLQNLIHNKFKINYDTSKLLEIKLPNLSQLDLKFRDNFSK